MCLFEQVIPTSFFFFFMDNGLNCSGMQRGFNFMKPETVDVSQIDLEFTTNYLSYIHM